jgi:hypothetical protein
MYLHLLGLKPPAGNIAPATATLGFRRYRATRAIYAACAGIGALAALWSVANAWQAFEVNAQASELAQQVSVQQTQYQQITRQFPPAPTSGENMKRGVEIARAMREAQRDPVGMMALLSEALQPSANLVLREFGWRHGLAPIEKGTEGATAVGAPLQPGAAPPARRQSAFVSGEIRPFRGDYRAAIDTINGLAARLRASPSVEEVRITKMPLNVDPKSVLSGNTLDSRSESGTAEFELVIVMKPRV